MAPQHLAEMLYSSLTHNQTEVAFRFEESRYTYQQLAERAASLQAAYLSAAPLPQAVGIIANQDFDTYAAIVACLLSGITYIPIEPSHPDERNNHMIGISGIKRILCSNLEDVGKSFYLQHSEKFILTQEGTVENCTLQLQLTANPAYILFTSGTTGIPKGVPVSMGNLESFVANVDAMGLSITQDSRFLQFIDLTFDLSVFAFLIPLLKGAQVFCLPKSPLKYTLAIQLIQDESVTHILTVPSFVQYLKPYFDEIILPSVKHWLFCGEALKSELVKGWQGCIPDGIIYNVYGPTEATIFCTAYRCTPASIKELNGITCIGKPFEGTLLKLFCDGETVETPGQTAELCIGGQQLTTGYIDDPKKNAVSFFEHQGNKFYHSGDLCRLDDEGDFFYSGRNDSQVKVHGGYRIELGEVEHSALKLNEILNCAAIAVEDLSGISVIYLFVQSSLMDEESLVARLKPMLPAYMLPKRIIFLEEIPVNLNGKTDRVALAQMAKKK